MSDERMNNDLIDEIMSNLKQLPVFGSTDTEDRDAAIDLITQLRERAEKAESEASRYESLHIRCSDAYIATRTQLTLAEQQRDAAVEGLENIDTYKLNMLAEWIDLKTQDNPDKEVQSDLRAWARSIDDTLARIREMGSQGWAKAAEAEAEIERLREIQRVQVKNLLLSVEGSWQAFGYEIREAIGNTNYNLIAENANELRAALGSDQALAPKETTDE